MAATLTLIEKFVAPERRVLSTELIALSQQIHRAHDAAIDSENWTAADKLADLREATTELLLETLRGQLERVS